MFSNFHTTTTTSYPQMIQEIVSDKWTNKFYLMSMNHIPSILSHLKDIPRDNDGLISTSNPTHLRLLNQKISELIVMDGVDPNNADFFYLSGQIDSKNITREIRNVLPLLWDDMKDAKEIARIVSLITDRTRTKKIQSYTSFNTIYNYIWGPIDKTISRIEERSNVNGLTGCGIDPTDNIPKGVLESHISSYLFKKSIELIHKKHTYTYDSLNNDPFISLTDHLKKLILLSYLLN